MLSIKQLKAIQKTLQEQDNRSTADPLFCVVEKEKVPTFVSAHFTEKAAQEYVRLNGHNLNRPHIHVISLFRCEEMRAVRNMLLNGDIVRLAEENEWLTSKLLRAGCVVQYDGSFFLENVPKMLAREFDLLKKENERLRCELDDLKSENAANGHIVNDVMSAIEADDCADLGYDIEQIYSERNALRQVCADAARKISEDVRDDGPCGREALTDVYIMLNEAANGGGE
jgi:hypothetical protein